MKNIFYSSTLAIIISFSSTNLFSQAFEKGIWNVDLGIGLGIYGTSQTNKYEIQANIYGIPYSQKQNTDTTDGAVSTVIPLSVEYGVSNKFGIGVDICYNNYFINDSDRVYLKSVKAFDFGPKFSYHPLNSDFYDLAIGLGIGFTRITWNYETVVSSFGISTTPEPAKGSGVYINLDIKNKFWFSEHIGAYLNLGYKGNFYSSISRDNSALETQLESVPGVSNVSIKDEFTFKMQGANIGIGLALKF